MDTTANSTGNSAAHSTSTATRTGTQLLLIWLIANAAGGVHGRQIRFIVEDNGSQPQLAVRAVQKLIRSDEVFALLNPFGSGTNAATIGQAVESGTIVFAPWAASAVMHQVAGNSPLVFTTVQNYNTTMQKAMERMIPEWGSQRVGLIMMEGPFGDLMRAGVVPAMANLGMEVVEDASYRPGEIDFSSQVARCRAANCDLIIAGTVIRETVGVMSEVNKLGWTDVKVLTGIPGRASLVAALGGADVNGLYGIGGWKMFPMDTTDAGARAFIDAYRAAYNSDPDENAAIALKPRSLSHEEAAAVPFGGLAALVFLRDFAKVKPGKKVLVAGASGGVGVFAVQLARHLGAEVTAVTSTRNVELVRSLGADPVVDYAREDFTRAGPIYDVIIDTAGTTAFPRAKAALAPKGVYVPLEFGFAEILCAVATAITGGRKVVIGINGDGREDLEYLAGLLESGELRPVVDSRYPLGRIADAHRRVESRHKTGSVVVTVDPPEPLRLVA